MEQKTNMQHFDEMSVKIFALLHESFPLPKQIDCITLAVCQEVDANGVPSKESQICVSALEWLSDEGFIKVGQFHQYGASGVVLTSKGLAKLKAIPTDSDMRQTIGERLETLAKAGAVPAAIEILKLIFA